MTTRATTLLPCLALIASANVAGQSRADVMETALHGSDSALIAAVRTNPRAARAAWHEFLKQGAGQADSATTATYSASGRIASAIAAAWHDSFFIRQQKRFQALSVHDQLATRAADSLWDAAVPLVSASGTRAAAVFRQALERYIRLADTSGVAATYNVLGVLFRNQQEYDSAVAYLTLARDAAEQVGDLQMLANALANLSSAKWRQGELGVAREGLSRAAAILERIGDSRGLIGTKNEFGLVAWSEGAFDTARVSFETGLALSRSINDSGFISLFLSNLGSLAAERGNYVAAVQSLNAALEIYRAQADSLQIAFTLMVLGQTYDRRGDYRSGVRVLTESAAILQRLGPDATESQVDEAGVRIQLGSTLAKMGDLQGARAELARAETATRRYPASRALASRTELAFARAEQALAFNELREAERQYLRANRLAAGETADRTRSRAQTGLADVFLRRDEYARASHVLERLLRHPTPDSHNMTLIRMTLGRTAMQRGDTATAQRAFQQSLEAFRTMGARTDEAGALGGLGDVALRMGRVAAAESLYEAGLSRLKTGSSSTWELRAALGRSMRARGALAEAARELHSAIDEIERISAGLQVEEQRAAFQADKWSVYADLALVEHTRGMPAEAFAVSERLRARQMLDLLARGQVGGQHAVGTLATREQDLRRQMTELSRQLDTVTTSEGMRGEDTANPALAQTRATLQGLQDAYQQLLGEIQESNPTYAALVRGETVGAPKVAEALGPDEALLEYLVGDSTTIAFVVTRDSVAAVDLHVPHSVLAAQVAFARAQLVSPDGGSTPHRDWRPVMRRLYRQLVLPIDSTRLLVGKERLIVVPHGELHYLPFAALLVPGPIEQPLVQRYVIEYVPSASVWLKLRERSNREPASGVVAFAPRPSGLPASRAEVEAVRRAFAGHAQVSVGSEATEAAFRSLAPQRDIIHLATHGVLNKHNPLFSFVQLGAGGTEDGRLEVQEVFGLSLRARLLVLSACQTGVGSGTTADVPPGDDWVGLVNAFLFAGAENVLGTLWPVQDASTARFMSQFYKDLGAGRSEALALALAQRAALRDRNRAHPFYWAGFSLVRGN